MKKTMPAMMAVLGASFAFGAVQNIEITDANAYAYSAENKLVCDSGSRINVKYSYSLNGREMKTSLIDFIEVTPAAEGAEEPWVSICVEGAGFTNNVDFSEQPYLWLSSRYMNDLVQLSGTYTPYGNEYRFGYSGVTNGELRGVCVKDLCDDPETGAPRSVLVRGTGLVSLNGGTFSGGVVVEGPAWLAVGGEYGFGTGFTKYKEDFVTVRNVGKGEGRINFKNSNNAYNMGFRIEGTNVFHSCGASKTVCTVFNGPITGEGCIRLTDQGGVRFTSPSNTFTGSLVMANSHAQYDVEIGFGNGGTASWKGSEIIQNNYTNNIIVVNCTNEFAFNTVLSANGGRLVKKGSGNLILGNAFSRKPISSRPDIPMIQIYDGTVTRTAQEPSGASGLISLLSGSSKLDLNNVPATSIWLPVGIGSIVNPADGAVTLSGAPLADSIFYGTVEGKVKLEMSGILPLRVSERTSFTDGLEVASGTLSVVDGFCIPSLKLAGGAVIESVERDEAKDFGLKMEIWYAPGGVSWGGDHANCMAKATEYADNNWDSPDFVCDMTEFGTTFYSGDNNETGGTSGSAFAKILGSSKNHFFARFTGYINIEEDGNYGFGVNADDSAAIYIDGTRIVNITSGNVSSRGVKESLALTAGIHQFRVDFCEETGWELLWVKIRKPGGEWECIPMSMLSPWNGMHSDFGTVTGEGAIALKSPDVVWPTMDLSGFTGNVLANACTGDSDEGYVAPANASIHFMDACDISGTSWWTSGPVKAIIKDGKSAWDMGGVAESNAYANRRKMLDLSKPFTVSFDYFIHQPWAGAGSLGDGFFLALHDKPEGGYGGTFSYTETGNRIKNTGAYGLQSYMMPSESQVCWIKNNKQINNVTTNNVYTMNNAKDPATPFHATLAWDLEKLVFSLKQDGKAEFAITNTAAPADLAAKFPDGKAYFGLWARNGGWYTAMTFADFKITEGDDFEPESVRFGGVLGVTNGITHVTCSSVVKAEIASDFLVTGDGTLSAAAGLGVGVTSAKWTFDLREPAAKLVMTGGFDIAGRSIVVDLLGEPQGKSRVLADLTGVENNAVTFTLSPDLPGSYRLTYSDGLLKVSSGNGTTIYIR